MTITTPTATANTTKTIAVFGGTGTVGAPLVTMLAGDGHHVRMATRQTLAPVEQTGPGSITHHQVDHASIDAITRTCDGADAAFVLTGTHPGQVEAECRLIDGAVVAGVPRIVKLSAPLIPGAPPMVVADWHRTIEAHLAASRVEHCSIRPMAFHQNWLRTTATIRRFGSISGSAADAPRTYLDARDVAAVAAEQLSTDAALEPAIALSGPRAWSYPEVAALLSTITGRAIAYKDLSPEAHHRALTKRAKLPDWLAEHIVDLDTLARAVPESGSEELARRLGRPARTLEDFLTDNAEAFARAPWRERVGLST